jgi:hypothetical protein
MKLTKSNIEQIEKLLNTEGMSVEVYITPSRNLDSGGGVMVKQGPKLKIDGRIPDSKDIQFPAVMLNTEGDTTVQVIAENPGEEPVSVAGPLIIPAGVMLAGFITRTRK